jgi:phosphatidylglycerol:prolipoprotein diacylglycerol transferase
MYPELFKIGPFTVYSFGLMMGISFIVANYLLAKELKRKGINPAFASSITLIALVAGISGSKILYLIENFGDFIQDPIGRALSPAGLTWYGGFILATAMIYLYIRSKKTSFWKIADAASPGLMWAYGIARIGCHLSGDGDYGIPTTLPWGVSYARGTYPPSEAFRNFPEIASHYPNGIVPDNTPLHPTPIYEFILATGIFLLLWRLRKRNYADGRLFMIYLIAAGLERFFIEFIRINPRILFGLSEAQIIAIVLIAVGLYGLTRFKAREATA